MKKVIIAAAVVCFAWVAWPYYALYELVSAIQTADQETLERRIDWQPLRQGLRDDFNALFIRKIAQETKSKDDQSGTAALGAGLAALIGPAIIDRAVDAYVTPAGVAALIKNERLANPRMLASAGGGTTPSPASPPDVQAKFDSGRIKYAFFSGGPTTFRVEVAPPQGAATIENGTLVFRWNGDWRLSRIIFPKDLLN